jgi:hypothetical protein
MGASVQARLDSKSQKALASLTRQLGWSPSKIIREGVQLLAACHLGRGERKVLGVGKFSSKVSDLGSNKGHLRDFGR